ncbi:MULTISPECIES: hypothetical protein [Pseudomonas]|uniref:Uncharacterized protein n=2 Tax=Pseudomonas TaxID=286 RepID=A0A9X8MHI4_9PSED|nr:MULTISPECIES: hypothetical protein [Pseudomonas]GGM32653.1 hypothetical protein GCM10009425_48940 [Pseudomonas asuensis]SER44034.1 hypothetical protein SAMN05216409_1223 [Pseudomonas lutea]
MGLKDLRKPAVPLVKDEKLGSDEAAEAFISGAPVSTAPAVPKKKKKSQAVFVRTTFSLSKKVNKDIDKLSLLPRDFRVSRSDVVRAGILALSQLEQAEVLALLEKAKNENVT